MLLDIDPARWQDTSRGSTATQSKVHAALWLISDQIIVVVGAVRECLQPVVPVRILACPLHLHGLRMPAELQKNNQTNLQRQ